MRKEKKDVDALSWARLVLSSVFVLIMAISIISAFSPRQSMKEFLDTNMADSLDGDFKEYDPGDTVVIYDVVESVKKTDGGYAISLKSTKKTGYHVVLHVTGTKNFSPPDAGDHVRITLHIGLSDDGEREIIEPLRAEDIEKTGGGWFWWV